MKRHDFDRLAKAIRQRRGETSLRDAADEIGINFTTLYKVESGAVDPSLDTYERICAWLGVSTEEFRMFPVAA